MAVWGQSIVTLFPVQNYNFGEKSPNPSKDASVEARIQRIQQQCVARLLSTNAACPATAPNDALIMHTGISARVWKDLCCVTGIQSKVLGAA